MIQIEQKTRNFIGLLFIGGVIAGMIFTGLIPPIEYQKYISLLFGALFYHVVKMLNPTQPTEGK